MNRVLIILEKITKLATSSKWKWRKILTSTHWGLITDPSSNFHMWALWKRSQLRLSERHWWTHLAAQTMECRLRILTVSTIKEAFHRFRRQKLAIKGKRVLISGILSHNKVLTKYGIIYKLPRWGWPHTQNASTQSNRVLKRTRKALLRKASFSEWTPAVVINNELTDSHHLPSRKIHVRTLRTFTLNSRNLLATLSPHTYYTLAKNKSLGTRVVIGSALQQAQGHRTARSSCSNNNRCMQDLLGSEVEMMNSCYTWGSGKRKVVALLLSSLSTNLLLRVVLLWHLLAISTRYTYFSPWTTLC